MALVAAGTLLQQEQHSTAGARSNVEVWYEMSRLWRSAILMTLDSLAGLGAVVVAFLIRFALDHRPLPAHYVETYLMALIGIVPLRLLTYSLLGLYRQMWAYASVPELLRIVWATMADALISTGIIFLIIQPEQGFPRSVLIIAWFLNLSALGTMRLMLRLRREQLSARVKEGNGASQQRTLIYGAGDAGAMLAREMAKHAELSNLVGFVDDDPVKHGMDVAGKRVLGSREDLEQIVKRHLVTDLIIAMPSVKGSVVREIIEQGRSLGLQIKTLPGLYELVNGKVSVNQIRDVQIEDLLGREENKVDLEAIAAYLSGETVLVTGAGGSIGSELCRQVARFGPRQLLLLGHGENSIYEIHLELQQLHPGADIRPIIADIQDEPRIRRIFEQYRPGVVFHAAAHKHVPLMEMNPEEAIKNNVFGTLHLARAADFFKVKRFVLISSDKAVNPTSVMGATKRAAEYVIQSFAATSSTVFEAVRFGNVLGSRGSVVPLFKKQIAAGGPVTITDPKMVRYFMTIPEAVQLTIQAAAMGRGGEVFVLDMGKPVRIVDLARDLIRLSGLDPNVDIKIEFTGIRQGEKLFEELLTAEEGTLATRHERIFVCRPSPITQIAFEAFLTRLQDMCSSGSSFAVEWIRSEIHSLISATRSKDKASAGEQKLHSLDSAGHTA